MSITGKMVGVLAIAAFALLTYTQLIWSQGERMTRSSQIKLDSLQFEVNKRDSLLKDKEEIVQILQSENSALNKELSQERKQYSNLLITCDSISEKKISKLWNLK